MSITLYGNSFREYLPDYKITFTDLLSYQTRRNTLQFAWYILEPEYITRVLEQNGSGYIEHELKQRIQINTNIITNKYRTRYSFIMNLRTGTPGIYNTLLKKYIEPYDLIINYFINEKYGIKGLYSNNSVRLFVNAYADHFQKHDIYYDYLFTDRNESDKFFKTIEQFYAWITFITGYFNYNTKEEDTIMMNLYKDCPKKYKPEFDCSMEKKSSVIFDRNTGYYFMNSDSNLDNVMGNCCKNIDDMKKYLPEGSFSQSFGFSTKRTKRTKRTNKKKIPNRFKGSKKKLKKSPKKGSKRSKMSKSKQTRGSSKRITRIKRTKS
jgi:hypothetical protein